MKHWNSWLPVEGRQAKDFVNQLASRIPSDEERARVMSTAREILSHGPAPEVDPLERGGRTGVALGYVQSGKTTSFTALAALATDNGFDVVVAMLGRTNLLVDLNARDMRAGLGIDKRSWDAQWLHLRQPYDHQAAAVASQSLKAGRKVLLTLMKHPTHIEGARRVLEALGPRRVLIIDDEADQASLNTRSRKGEQSAIYREILGLRAAAGAYLYVQYTATPFAPLLLEPTDELSPEFLVQLEPGSGYVGGRTYFVDRRDDLVRPIDLDEAQLENLDGLPAGLKEALGSFFVAAALIKHQRLTQEPPVSMLVHPSHLRHVHKSYFGVIDAAIDDWSTRLSRPSTDPGRAADVAFFAECFEDFRNSTDVSFDQLLPDLVQVVRDTRRWLVNSDGEALELDWMQGNVHVLVGGSILDRGFVVKGLTTTYLTRGESGSGQADTIEQRGRYFGYKRDYLDVCRVFTPKPVADTFQALVHTESAMRESLLDHIESGGALSSWAEDSGIELPANVRPTRENVTRAIARSRVAGEFHAMRSPSTNPRTVNSNANLIARLLDWDVAELREFSSNARYHVIPAVDPPTILELLRDWQPGDDTQAWAGTRFLTYLEHRASAGALTNFAVTMLTKPGTAGTPRDRTWASPETGMGALLQGSDAKTGYPGDRALFPVDIPQLQIHRVRPQGAGSISELHALALYVPSIAGYPDGIVRAL